MGSRLSPPHLDIEPARLAALHRLDLLDTAPEPAFDRITHLARTIFAVEAATMSLIDADRQWFKSVSGSGRAGASRRHALCDLTIQHDSVFVVPDAWADRRFARNPLVVEPPGIRFYAGAPLIVSAGLRIGSLCLLDPQPRDFSADDMRCLAGLAAMVVGECWMRTLEGGRDQAASSGHGSPPFASDVFEERGLTGTQLRAARGLLDLSISEMAALVDVSAATLKRIEGQNGAATARRAIVERIVAFCEARGVVFLGGANARASGATLRVST